MTASILLVDDDVELLKALTKVLEKEGYKVVGLPDACAALNRLRRCDESFDLVISDMSMPGMTGLELFASLKTFAPVIPFILITAHGDLSRNDEAIGTEAFQCLHKPLDKAELLAAVRRAFAGAAR